MAKLLAIDWDAKEARYVAATSRGARLEIESAGSVPIEASEAANNRVQVAAALKVALAGKSTRATVTLLSVSRSQVELVSLSLPPAADADLPDMVRNQAMRTNTAIGEDAVIDFVALPGAADATRSITAAALPRARLEQLEAVLTDAAASAKSIALRPYATGALVRCVLDDPQKTCLVVNVVGEEVDLVVLSQGDVVYWRSLRQAGASRDPAAAARLVTEMQRTLVVAAPQLAGRAVESVYLCGGLDEHPALVEAARGAISQEVVLVDPFAAQGGLTDMPEGPGRFASLVGMLVEEARGERQAIDFLSPRQRPAPPDRRRMYILAGAAAALVVLLGGYRMWSTFSALDGEIETLSTELDRLDEQMKYAAKKQKVITAIEGWTKNDIVWLDELRDLSLRFPSGRDAMVSRMSLSQGRAGGGSVDMTGIVRDPVVVSQIEQNLRDTHHNISSRHMQQREAENNYSWHFESSLAVSPHGPQDYISHLPPAEQAARAEAAKTKAKQPARASLTKGKERRP